MNFAPSASIIQGLNEALAFTQGKEVGAKVHHVEMTAIEVGASKKRTGLTQSNFAKARGDD